MPHRFCFLAQIKDNEAVISGEEQHHLRRVLRLKQGVEVELIDGCGKRGLGVISELHSQHSVVTLNAPAIYEPPPNLRVELAIGALKHGTFDTLVAPLSELGVAKIHCFHQQGAPKSRLSEKSEQRWQRLLISAAKQCKRAWLAEVVTHDSLQDLELVWRQDQAIRVYLDPSSNHNLAELTPDNDHLQVVMGGEMGLASHEQKLLEDGGFRPMRISPFVLRATTAAVAAAAVLSHHIRVTGH